MRGRPKDTRPPCPRVTRECHGRLDYHPNPERLVCSVCQFVWPLEVLAGITEGGE